jgi:hypothetical protein
MGRECHPVGIGSAQEPDEPNKKTKRPPLAEVSRKTATGSVTTAPAALCCHHPRFNGLIAQAIPIQTLASLFRQYLRAIIRSGCKVVYGFCR